MGAQIFQFERSILTKAQQAAPLEVEIAVETALRCGYRHIDCAAIYRNEVEVGNGIKNSGVKREEIFITSKLWNTCHEQENVESALDKTLKDLGTSYLDLYLMHWPVAFVAGSKFFPLDPDTGVFRLSDIPVSETYGAMEKLLSTGKVKAIGVSNFNIAHLSNLLDVCTVAPAVNQIEKHPYLQQTELAQFCASKGILITAYSPLGNNQTGEPRTVDDSKVHAIAKDLGMDPGQVLISWGVQTGHVVLPKSVTESRIKSNFQADLLPSSAIIALNKLERHKRFNFPARWGYDIFGEAGKDEVKRIAKEAGPENKEKFVV